MKKLLALCVCGLITQVALAEAPAVGFVSPGPGLNAPLDDDADPVTYGQKWGEGDGWTYDGDSASGSVVAAQPYLRPAAQGVDGESIAQAALARIGL